MTAPPPAPARKAAGPGLTLGAFVLALCAVFGGAVAVGHAVGPVGTADRPTSTVHSPAQPAGHVSTTTTTPAGR